MQAGLTRAKMPNFNSGVAPWTSTVAATPAATKTSPMRIRISSSLGTSGKFKTVHLIHFLSQADSTTPKLKPRLDLHLQRYSPRDPRKSRFALKGSLLEGDITLCRPSADAFTDAN